MISTVPFKADNGLTVGNNVLIVNTQSNSVGINTTNTYVTLTVIANDGIQIPVGNTGQRPTANSGVIRFNTDEETVEYVANGAWSTFGTSVTSANLSYAATTLWNVAASQIATLTLTGNTTLSNATSVSPGSYILFVYQDGSGSRYITWSGKYYWAGGVAPVLSTGASALDVFSFVSDGNNMIGTYINNVQA